MFQIICKIGPLSIATYGAIIAIIAVLVSAVLMIMARLGRMSRKVVSTIFFWTIAFTIAMAVLLLTSVTIYSYGLMLAIAVAVGTFLLVRDARRSHIHLDLIFDLVFWAVIGGIIGARTFYIVLNYSFFIKHPSEIVMIQNGGLAWQGGLIFGSIAVIRFIKIKKLPLSQTLDVVVPYLALGQSIGRVGCFLNGCCHGRELAGGIYFPVHDAHLHPTQLYLSLGYFVIYIVLKQYQKFSQLHGLVFVMYLVLASSLRFGVEFFRADHEILLLGLSIFQFVCFGVLVFAFCFARSILTKNST